MIRSPILLALLLASIFISCSEAEKEELTVGKDYKYQFTADREMLSQALLNRGNDYRLIQVMKKAERGENIVIGVIGGSITYGASAPIDKSYAKLVLQWWKKRFPQARIKLVNAGKSGTGSLLGAHRVQKDLLDKQPDFIITEFAVNDEESPRVNEAYESLIRRILLTSKVPAQLLLMMCTQEGYSTAEDKIQTGLHYSLPVISYRSSVYRAVEEGRLDWNDISSDFIHPNTTGHQLIADLVIEYFEEVYKVIETNLSLPAELPESRTGVKYLKGNILYGSEIPLLDSGGFLSKERNHWIFPFAFQGVEYENPMIFRVRGKSVSLVYNQRVDGRGGLVRLKVNGEFIKDLSARSPFAWENIFVDEIITDNEISDHEISLEFLREEDSVDGEKEFTLLAVLFTE